MPRAADFAFLQHDGPIAFAHRGGASEAPENTLPAFQRAVDLGYRYLETDVHLTADGVLVAFHDDVLDRVTDRTGTIAELPWSVVREAKVDGREPIPLFEDLLGAFPEARVNVDPKHDASVEPLAEVLRRCDAVERVCVGAFSDGRIERLRQILGPALCTSLGPLGTAQLRGLSLGDDVADALPAPCAQVPPAVGETVLVDEAFVAAAHERGLQVHVWTVDDEHEMRHLLDLGVDGIMTDQPLVLKAVLEARGQWRP